MTYRVEYSHKAVKDLERLDRPVARRIVKKIGEYAASNDPLAHAKKLKTPFNDLYRFRIGEYRAVFEQTANDTLVLLTVLKVAHRKEVYE